MSGHSLCMYFPLGSFLVLAIVSVQQVAAFSCIKFVDVVPQQVTFFFSTVELLFFTQNVFVGRFLLLI